MVVFDPKDFLKLAQDLVNDANYDHESCFRTCISRAYYAAFLVCRTFLEFWCNFSFPQTADVHKKVIMALRKRKVIKVLKGSYGTRYLVADMLDQLRKNGRNKADYNLNIMITKGHALKWIQQARSVIDRVT